MAFTAHPEEVARLRRAVGIHLAAWGLADQVDTAQLCVSELVSNIVTHVGAGTPGSLVLSTDGERLRVEVHDPDTRALPTLVDAEIDAEGGRGMALVDALTDRWGVELYTAHKVTWCEVVTEPTATTGGAVDPSVTRAEALLNTYATLRPPTSSHEPGRGRVGRAVAEESVIDVITDFLRWLRVRGCDADEVLDRAQSRYEATLSHSRR
ncbi:ATP-binding protein [Streptomyces sp. DSM 41972]|uniref:ATP-binding protein n=1 Tax=Streptomyces althioticus subsp. attaecolombicae TaxID=3075534 RepID=A0ABU3I517_9ACTN|nr:ATP-binding protein [Streptomyces sp. DSM 41972]SCD46299.1 Anti-sigma regulatory factor (Ser/Thr protein kinase) [Streptomyces sp. di188]SCE00828.1 Anti-sigma regulatory factor (Ser/Thr protein kinase) [Streptomyces sp. di50b]